MLVRRSILSVRKMPISNPRMFSYGGPMGDCSRDVNLNSTRQNRSSRNVDLEMNGKDKLDG